MSFAIFKAEIAEDARAWAQGQEIAQWVSCFERSIVENREGCERIQQMFIDKAEEVNREYRRGSRVMAVVSSSYDYKAAIHRRGLHGQPGKLIAGITMMSMRWHLFPQPEVAEIEEGGEA